MFTSLLYLFESIESLQLLPTRIAGNQSVIGPMIDWVIGRWLNFALLS